jgi:hypothetical protein
MMVMAKGRRYNSIRTGRQVVRWNVLHTFEREGYPISEDLETNLIAKRSLAREIRQDDVQGTSRVLQSEASTSARKGFDVNPAICDFLRREDELMTELMNHKRSTSY